MKIRDDMLLWLSCVELKSPKRSGLRDDWEHWRYLGGNVLKARSSFWNGSGVTETFNCVDTWHYLVRVRFLTTTDIPALLLIRVCERETEERSCEIFLSALGLT